MKDDLQQERIAELEDQLGALQKQLAVLQTQTAALLEQNHRLKEENQALRDELAVLKHQKPKPSIRPSRLHEGDGKRRKNKDKRKSGKERKVDHTVVVKLEQVPQGSRFKGYSEYVVQELVVKVEATLYRVEKWLTPEGKLVRDSLGEIDPMRVWDGVVMDGTNQRHHGHRSTRLLV